MLKCPNLLRLRPWDSSKESAGIVTEHVTRFYELRYRLFIRIRLQKISLHLSAITTMVAEIRASSLLKPWRRLYIMNKGPRIGVNCFLCFYSLDSLNRSRTVLYAHFFSLRFSCMRGISRVDAPVTFILE